MTAETINIRPMGDNELELWGALRTKLWPDCLEPENQNEYRAFRSGTGAIQIVLLAFSNNNAIGFAEIGERSVVDGCRQGPVAYLEGWYVDPEFRAQGVGTRLVEVAHRWALDKSYVWFASDVELDNIISQRAHIALGFEESGRAINYRKRLVN